MSARRLSSCTLHLQWTAAVAAARAATRAAQPAATAAAARAASAAADAVATMDRGYIVELEHDQN